MIKVENLHKNYDELEVLKGINYEFKDNQTTAILGSSGSGKSTLLRCLNRLESFHEGKIYFDGVDIKTLDKRQYREQIGMVFQNFNLFENMTVIKNITYALLKVKKESAEESEKKALHYLELVGLSDKKDVYPHNLSGGQKQRVAIARGLAMNPKVLLFDEPTSALDPETVGEVLEVIKKLASSGMTCIIVTHEMAFARDVAKDIVFMDSGVICEAAPSSEFFSEPKTERAKQFLKRIL